jgi:hypothetical protein
MSVFNGVWKIDVGRSKMWDHAKGEYVPELVGQEIITLKIVDGVQDYEVLYGSDPVIRMGYTTRYDVPEWVPYAVREIVSESSRDEAEAVDAFRQRIGANQGPNARNFVVGKPYALVRIVYVDERTHYRISKAEDGSPQNVLLRRMAEDGQSYLTVLLDAEGVAHRIRTFARASS